MNTKMKKSYAEVRAILDLLGNTYKEKIPEKLLELFYLDSEYVIEFDKNIPIEEISVTREALVIIAILNLKYWENDAERIKELQEQYQKNEINYQDTFIVKKYEQESIDDEILKTNEEKLIVLERENIFIKIKKFIDKLLKR